MEKTGWIERFNLKFLQEKGLATEIRETRLAGRQKSARKKIAEMVKEVGKDKDSDLDLILSVERRFLENDLAEYANSDAMKGSLTTALAELTAAEAVIPLVKDPVLYAAIDKGHGQPKSRIGALPNDAARQFFSAHHTRLLNQDKARLDSEEKLILDARRANILKAERLYIPLQRQALGLSEKKAPDKGQDRGLTR